MCIVPRIWVTQSLKVLRFLATCTVWTFKGILVSATCTVWTFKGILVLRFLATCTVWTFKGILVLRFSATCTVVPRIWALITGHSRVLRFYHEVNHFYMPLLEINRWSCSLLLCQRVRQVWRSSWHLHSLLRQRTQRSLRDHELPRSSCGGTAQGTQTLVIGGV